MVDESNRNDLIRKLDRLMRVEYVTEKEGDMLVQEIERHFPSSEALHVALHSSLPTAEDVMRRALDYQVIMLPDESGGRT